jgi:hypothetical protein
MPNWIGKCLCIVAAIGVLDGHLMVAQSWAWFTMVQDRAHEMGVSEALDSTFSGDAPCPMCCAIQEERQEKEEQAPVPESKSTAKYLPASQNTGFVFFSPKEGFQSRAIDRVDLMPSRQETPPSPPPQLVV